jgi:putative phosphoesterase
MRIGLITDTHIPVAADELPPQVAKAFKGVDLILHAGDIYRASIIDDLEVIAPVLVALGDDDPFNLTEDKRVAMKHVLNVEGHTLWLVHERPYMFHLTSQQKAEAPDIVVHGHSHEAHIQNYNGVLFIGSGSPTFLNYRRGLGTVGILEVSPGDAQASIVHL